MAFTPANVSLAPDSMSVLLQASAITKRFPGVIALNRVSFDLVPGEIHALCGENGAGKSTLIKLLSGLHPAGSFEGELSLDGQLAIFHRVADAQQSGIAVIHQELALVGELTVAENLFLGNERRRGGFLDWEKTWTDARSLLSKVGLDISPDTLVRDLGIGQQQMVEIAKAIARDMRILILDEPTAALSEHEVQTLLTLLRELRSQGIACIYISHKLDEVFALADRITVLRDGATISTVTASETDKADIIRHMVGREISQLFPRHISQPGEETLRVSNLSVALSLDEKPFLHDISLHVRAGEVLGIGGLMGAGRTELMMHLFGAWGHRLQGEVTMGDQPLLHRTPQGALNAGLALVSEDRKRYGLVIDESIGFNFSLSSIGRLLRGLLIDEEAETHTNQKYFDDLRVKAPSLETSVGTLSGGNQQKIVIGKALMTEPKVILLDEPTRGIDVGAKLEVYELINQLTKDGRAVILVSSELPEIIGMSDRILMLHEGRIGGEFTREEATPERLLAAAMGAGAMTKT